jgi:hypothetical protein
MNKINDQYGLNLDPSPCLDRCSGSPLDSAPVTGTGKLIIIGASHTSRIVGGLAVHSQHIVNLTKPGWIVDEEAISKLRKKLMQQKISPEDIIVIDPISNNTFCGTDKKGNPADPVKLDGKWHLEGELNVRSKSYIKTCLSGLKFIFEEHPENKIICIMPIPRYLTGKCCGADGHITNFAEQNFDADLQLDLEMVEDMLMAWLQSHKGSSALIHYRSIADTPEAPLKELCVEGEAMWQTGDPVHCTNVTYTVLTKAVMSAVEEPADTDSVSEEPATKRRRLESVVVVREPPAIPNPTPVQKPQGWSSGVLPNRPTRGRGLTAPRGRW